MSLRLGGSNHPAVSLLVDRPSTVLPASSPPAPRVQRCRAVARATLYHVICAAADAIDLNRLMANRFKPYHADVNQ